MRKYNSCYVQARPILDYVIANRVPVVFFNLETTGLDPVNDEILQIAAAKCLITDDGMKILGYFSSFVRPHREITDFVVKFTGRPASFFADQPDISAVMAKAAAFFGNTPVVASWTAENFAVPFLENAGFMTGHMIYPVMSLDLMRIAQCVSPATRVYSGYSFRTIAEKMDVAIKYKERGHDARADVEAYLRLFGKMFPDFRTGRDPVNILSSKYYERSIYVRGLAFETDRGAFHIDGVTGFMVEDTPGFFDAIDADALAQKVMILYRCSSLSDVVKKVYVKNHTPVRLEDAR